MAPLLLNAFAFHLMNAWIQQFLELSIFLINRQSSHVTHRDVSYPTPLYVSMKKYGGFKYNYNAKRKRMMSKGEEEKVDGRKENEKNDGSSNTASYGAL